MVTRVGKARIEAAGWHAIQPVGDGLRLVATDEPPDARHPTELATVAGILERLGLPAQ